MRDIYTFVEEKEAEYRQPIILEDGWYWNMKNHIRRSFLYKNSQFEEENDDRKLRPYKNIVRPILNIQYRTEGFDVKDIELFVDNSETYYKSFLVKKFHEKWALKNEIDTFIDDLVESYVDYGGVLVKNIKGVRPEVVDLRTLAFCDQTNILAGPFAIKHYFSPSELKEKEKVGWGNASNGATISIDSLILKAENHKHQDEEQQETKTPGKYVEIYEVHNCSPRDYDLAQENSDPHMYIIGFYDDENGQKHGVTLFESKEPRLLFKFLKRDPIQGRALGFGGVEELFEPQVWTNFSEIAVAEMLASASKTLYWTDDQRLKGQNLVNKDSGSIIELQENKQLSQIDTLPRNITAFSNYVVEMHEHAMEMGAASDLFLGQQPNSGTPFKSVEQQLVEGKSLHLWRQGRIAVFADQIYREWVLPYISKEITNGVKFLATLSADELMVVSDAVVSNEAARKFKTLMFEGKTPTQEEIELVKTTMRESLSKQGNKRFLEILKGEMEGEKLDVSTNIVGKQKDLSLLTDKMVNVLRQFIATPQIRQDPEMLKWLNSILESSGLSPIMFSPRTLPVETQGGSATEPLKDLSKAQQPA